MKLITIAIGYPLLLFALNITFKASDIVYLTNEVLDKYINSRATLIAVILVYAVISIYSMYEMTIVTTFHNFDFNDVKINDGQIMGIINKNFKKLLKWKNIPVFIYGAVIPMLSIANLSLWVYKILDVAIEIELSQKMQKNIDNISNIAIVLAVLLMFTVCIVINEKKSFFSACKKSIRLVMKNFFKISLFLLILNLLYVALIGLLYIVYSLVVVAGVKILDKNDIGLAVYLSALRSMSNGIIMFILVSYLPLTYMSILTMYRVFNKKRFTQIQFVREGKSRFAKVVFYAVLLIALGINIAYLKNAIINNPFSNLEMTNVPNITAHRGSSAKAPENTMAAFQRAVSDVADYVELDVKQTKDNVVIVLHDKSLKRTTGDKKKIWTVDYEYLQTLDAGSWFSPKYEGERIPTLEEVLVYCRGKVRLNIEIKPTGHDNNLEKQVVELVEQYDMVDQCVITSMKYDVLKRVKKCNPKIKTGYIMSAAYGNFYNMEYADFFSVNYSFVDKRLVDLIHNNGKTIHVWTVNGSDNIKEMTKIGVDNIITDNPVKCRELIYSKYSNERIMDILKYVFER